MRSHATVLSVIVALALAGGLAAFLLASPDEGRRPSGTGLGFERLSPEELQARITDAAEHHRAAHRMLLARRGATRNARAWLTAVGGSGAPGATLPQAIRPAPTDPAARRRVLAFVRWADDLPRDAWVATAGAATALDAAAEPSEGAAAAGQGAFEVKGTVQVSVAQASTRARPQQVPVTLQLVGVVATPTAAPHAWRIRDVVVGGPTTFLRAYADPVIVHRPTVDVVAPIASKALAARLATDASTRLPALVARYRRLAGHGVATIWILEDGSRSGAVLGARRPTATTTAASGEVHGAAWTTAEGDVVADARRLARLAPDAQLAAIRHALAHVATRGLQADAPALFSEGVPLYEERRFSNADAPLAGEDLERLVEAFGRAESGLAALLVAAPGTPLDTGTAGTDQLAALATIAWLEEARDHATLVRLLGQLDAGVDPARALRNVLRLDARGVEVAVARWTRDQVDADDEPAVGTPVPGEDDATAEDR